MHARKSFHTHAAVPSVFVLMQEQTWELMVRAKVIVRLALLGSIAQGRKRVKALGM
jgi:hypothetical protein